LSIPGDGLFKELNRGKDNMLQAYLDTLTEVTQLRQQWTEQRDVAVAHLSACSNAVQELTYLAGTAQEEFAAKWEIGGSSNPKHLFTGINDDNGGHDDEEEQEQEQDLPYNPLARASARARTVCRLTRDKEHGKLMAAFDEMARVVSQMQQVYDVAKTTYNTMVATDRHWETSRIGLTWCCNDVLNMVQEMIHSYRQELFVKACIVDDLVQQTDIDVLLAYAATFLSEPFIDGNHLDPLMETAKYDLSNAT
jgi:hypothetical protein